ncbi:MAG: hypothetical protein D6753_17565 [Planctomycetota bacterium]|nr:MAG: hypothetical protein D6753_17565 [Planctomycetota bacterium]
MRGIANRHGTHRFVLWLPAVWRDDPELTSVLSQNLRALLGQSVEWLADDPQQAMKQYNAPETDVPLLAFDEHLDALSVGLVDCPDVQTGILPGMGPRNVGGADAIAARRQELLRRVGKACSAFILVTNARFLRDATVGAIYRGLVEAMPRAKRFLALNRVNVTITPSALGADIASFLSQYPCTGVYVAYRFDSPNYHDLPPPLRCQQATAGGVSGDRPSGAGQQLPCFFRLPPDGSVDLEHVEYLRTIGRELDAGVLSHDRRRSVVHAFVEQAHHGREWLEDAIAGQFERAVQAGRVVWSACRQELRDPQHPHRYRIQASATVAQQYSMTLRNTAPGYLRWALKAMDPVQWAYQQIGQMAGTMQERVKVGGWIRKPKWWSELRKNKPPVPEANVIRPEELVSAMRDADRTGALAEYDDSLLVQSVSAAMERFTQQDPTKLPADELESWCRAYWDSISGMKKLKIAAKPIVILAAPMLAVLMIPFDFGGTAVIAAASVKELLIALGVSAVGVALGGDDALQLAVEGVGQQQMSNLFAVLCDALCIPRAAGRQFEQPQLHTPTAAPPPPPTIDPQPRELPCGVYLWHIDNQWQAALESELHSLLTEPE